MTLKHLGLAWLMMFSIAAEAQTNAPAVSAALRAEQIRAECIEGRRYVCGRVVEVATNGLVVDSGYTALLQPPFNQSWVVRGNVSVNRDPAAVEQRTPDAACIGLVFITGIPKRPAIKLYDFAVLHGYPAGQFTYAPVPGVKKIIRRFSASLDYAVYLNLAPTSGPAPASRGTTKAYLRLPSSESGAMPPLLSQTGAFKDTARLVPNDGLLPYELNYSFWSDGAAKSRWLALPNEPPAQPARIGFSPTGEWSFPAGTVLVKHFELATNEARPELKRRLETRFIVCTATGSVYGVTYKWRPDNSDADLLTNSLTEKIQVLTSSGVRTQSWYYPSRQDCRTCHTERAGGVLGLKTRQLNRAAISAEAKGQNQLSFWNQLGLFTPAIDEAKVDSYPKLAEPGDSSRTTEDRARSYLDANCAHCHRPGGTVATFDCRYDIPLPKQNLIDGQVLFDQGLDHARVIAPHDRWRSLALLRVLSLEGDKMPPLAHNVLDREGVTVLREWIESLPGPNVLAPPNLSPSGGKYTSAVEVTLAHDEPGVKLHYTLDGSEPTHTDPVYTGPIKLTGPTTLRAKAYKPGFTHSITAQQTFIVND